MRSILGIFVKPPFKHLQQHMRKVKECVDEVVPLLEALMNEDYERLEEQAKRVGKLEHEADIIKDQMRNRLPKSIFMSVDRGDLLEVLSSQDAISDAAEDLAVLLTIKRMKVPDALKPGINMLLNKVMVACNQAYTMMEEIDDLVETSFRGLEAEKVLRMIEELGTMEWEADKKQFELVKSLFEIEKEISPVDIYLWMKIFEKIGDLANNAERMGNRLRLMLSKA